MNKIVKYEDLSFTDNFLFVKILSKNLELCRKLLELILKISIKKVVLTEGEKALKITHEGKGVRLDVYVNDETGTVYDIEMQTTKKSDLAKRTRYYQGMLDLNIIEQGALYKDLKKCFVIFICLEDPFTFGLHVYTFSNICHELPMIEMGDETYKVFVNASGTADDIDEEMANFLNYLKTKSVKGTLAEEIDSEVKNAINHQEWRDEYMTLYMRDQEMREEGRAESRVETALHLLQMGILTVKQIAEATCLSVEEILNLQKTIS